MKPPLDLHPRSAGTLPPSFTQPIHSQYHLQHKSKHHHRRHASSLSQVTSTSHPATTSSATSILADAAAAAAPRALLLEVNPAVARSGVSTLLSPQNHGLRPHTSYTPARRRDNLASSRKRRRKSPQQHSLKRNNSSSNSNNNNSLDQWPRPDGSEESFLLSTNGAGGRGHGGGGGGGLWGPTGLPPTGVVDPSTSSMPLETEWACPSSTAATSTPSLHDGFSDVSKTNQWLPVSHLRPEERQGAVVVCYTTVFSLIFSCNLGLVGFDLLTAVFVYRAMNVRMHGWGWRI